VDADALAWTEGQWGGARLGSFTASRERTTAAAAAPAAPAAPAAAGAQASRASPRATRDAKALRRVLVRPNPWLRVQPNPAHYCRLVYRWVTRAIPPPHPPTPTPDAGHFLCTAWSGAGGSGGSAWGRREKWCPPLRACRSVPVTRARAAPEGSAAELALEGAEPAPEAAGLVSGSTTTAAAAGGWLSSVYGYMSGQSVAAAKKAEQCGGAPPPPPLPAWPTRELLLPPRAVQGGDEGRRGGGDRRGARGRGGRRRAALRRLPAAAAGPPCQRGTSLATLHPAGCLLVRTDVELMLN
jgi:hypothetical protein